MLTKRKEMQLNMHYNRPLSYVCILPCGCPLHIPRRHHEVPDHHLESPLGDAGIYVLRPPEEFSLLAQGAHSGSAPGMGFEIREGCRVLYASF